MTHGSLFSGIGGFDLAAEWMGWENVFHCEINEFCQKVLKYYWPNAKSYHDIKQTDFTEWNGKIDVISGGFPCQPYSIAGKRKGKADDRHLWPQMLRAIREIQPNWIVGENVPGLINWSRGMVLAEIKSDLESEGFEVFPPCILPACSKNAPHRRDRLWIIAYSKNNFSNNENRDEGSHSQEISEKRFNEPVIIANSAKIRLSNKEQVGELGWLRYCRDNIGGVWEKFPTQSPICNGDDGLSSQLGGITFSKWRTESIIGGGNAIVPQVAFELFKTIEQFETINHENQAIQ